MEAELSCHLLEVARQSIPPKDQLRAVVRKCLLAKPEIRRDGRVVIFALCHLTGLWSVACSTIGEPKYKMDDKPDFWIVVWGRRALGPRNVVALFHHKWMVYDQYGILAAQPCEPRAGPAAGAGDDDGPVPNTRYGDDDNIELTDDALRLHKAKEEDRRELADDVRAEAGEGEFELGSSLRLRWVPAQRADKALLQLFCEQGTTRRLPPGAGRVAGTPSSASAAG